MALYADYLSCRIESIQEITTKKQISKLSRVVMSNHKLVQFGFKLNINSTHTARTIMLNELSVLLEWVSDSYSVQHAYLKAIVEENCLQKQSVSNRKITARHLNELYGLDPLIVVFRALRYLWNRDVKARPLIALLCACTRDAILHDVVMKVLDLPLNTSITSENTEIWIDEIYPWRFSKVTLRTLAKNINSTWTQVGYLNGKVNKIRVKAVATPGSIAYALFLAYLSGARGIELFETKYVKLLDCSMHDAISLAQEASQRGWIAFNRIGDVIDIRFPNFLNQQEVELLFEQNR